MSDTTGATADIDQAIRDLEDALRQASEAAARIKEALPRFERITAVFGELESIIANGRSEGQGSVAPDAPVRMPRAPRAKQPAAASAAEDLSAVPETIAPAPSQAASLAELVEAVALVEEASTDEEPIETIAAIGAHGDKLISFRLEVQSQPGPLDLRAVDDAISGHDAVRDVALIDYDGRRATLKVWIAGPASPAEVQKALSDRAGQMTSDGNHVSIVALEDVA
jgi:hypothetical protein